MTENIAPRRKFVGRKKASGGGSGGDIGGIEDIGSNAITTGNSKKLQTRSLNRIPDDILNDEELNQAIKILPKNYNFEIHKTIWHIRKSDAKRVALQMPEGLLLYSCIISDILEQFCGVETVVMGDVTYGACCIDDFTALSLDCDFLVHYAHSCLVPIAVTRIKVLYVFVTIDIDKRHLIATLGKNFSRNSRLALVGTIQFNPTLHAIYDDLFNEYGIVTSTPQAMPLSKGEVLGCTSARLSTNDIDAIVYIGDGRFHLESAMIHNPEIDAYKYDPYNREFTIETFDHEEMYSIRRDAIRQAKNAKKVGIILGALGRQGNIGTLDLIEKGFKDKNIKTVLVLLSEIFPGKLAQFDDVDCWVQVACPRLSIDWGYAFPRPLLTPYEAMVSLDKDQPWDKYYPMDYYSKDGYGRGKIPSRTLS